MAVRIIIDSTADTRPGIRDRFLVVPMTLYFGDEEFIDGVTIDHRRFYEKLIESDLLPHTSQATPEAFAKAYRQVAEQGDTAVVLTISSKLSGTYQSAVIAAEDFEGRIFVVDSLNVAIGSGILAERALQLADSGVEARELAAQLEQLRERVRLVALLDTLEYLKKGGRISKTAAFAGGVLSIKPVIAIRDGEVAVVGKARGSKQGNNQLEREMQAAGGIDFSMPLLLGYSGLGDQLLQKYIEDSRHIWEGRAESLPVTPICSVIGTHAGPGAVAVAFFKP